MNWNSSAPIPQHATPVEDLYSTMDELLNGSNGGGKVTVNIQHLPEMVRTELSGVEQRFLFDPTVELNTDTNAFIVKCILKREQVPPLRLVIPRNYPAGTLTVERTLLDIDSFPFDDLQSTIHEQFVKQPVQGITDILNIWDNTVQQFYSVQMPQSDSTAPSVGQPITMATSSATATYPVSSPLVGAGNKMSTAATAPQQPQQQRHWQRQQDQMQQQPLHPNYNMPSHNHQQHGTASFVYTQHHLQRQHQQQQMMMMMDPNMPSYGSPQQQMMPPSMAGPPQAVAATQPMNNWIDWNSAAAMPQQQQQQMPPWGAYPNVPTNATKIGTSTPAYISPQGGVIPTTTPAGPFYAGGMSTSTATAPMDLAYQQQQHYQAVQQQYNYQQQKQLNMYTQQQQLQFQYQQQQHLMQRQQRQQMVGGEGAQEQAATAPTATGVLQQNSWDASACHSHLAIVGTNCSVVKLEGGGCRSVFAKLSILSTNFPIFYFEVKVKGKKGPRSLGVGFAPKSMPLDTFVGGHENSYGYLSGGLFCISNSWKGIGTPNFSAGDTVGCGVILATGQLIFTKNGQRLVINMFPFSCASDLFVSPSSTGPLFPCVSLYTVGITIEANFGPDFTFNIGTLFEQMIT